MEPKRISVLIKYLWNCRTVLQMHTWTCMCGALCDLCAALVIPPPLQSPPRGGGTVTLTKNHKKYCAPNVPKKKFC